MEANMADNNIFRPLISSLYSCFDSIGNVAFRLIEGRAYQEDIQEDFIRKNAYRGKVGFERSLHTQGLRKEKKSQEGRTGRNSNGHHRKNRINRCVHGSHEGMRIFKEAC